MHDTDYIEELTEQVILETVKMPLIYVSGPYRAPTAWKIEKNIRSAEEYALKLWKLGAAVICPHVNTRFYQGELPDNAWLAGDLALINGCDAIFMLPGWKNSEGALVERFYAQKLQKSLLYDIYFAENYIKNFRSQKLVDKPL